MEWLTGKVGETAAKWIFAIVVILFLLMAGLTLLKMVSWRHHAAVEAQATQTTKSGEAIAGAAADAVNTVAAQSNRETQIDAATAVALEKIDHAQDPVAVRSAVVDALCLRDPSYCERPAR